MAKDYKTSYRKGNVSIINNEFSYEFISYNEYNKEVKLYFHPFDSNKVRLYSARLSSRENITRKYNLINRAINTEHMYDYPIIIIQAVQHQYKLT